MAYPKYPAEIKQQALDLLSAGESSVSIGKLLNVPPSTICTWGYHKGNTKRIPASAAVQLIADYQRGISLTEIEKQTGFNRKAIANLLKEQGVSIIDYGKRIQRVKINPFADLTNPEVNYWLGLLAADGHVLDNGKTVLSSVDLDILEKFAQFTGCSKPLHGQGRVWTCGFINKEVAAHLNNLGITPRKSLTLEMQIPLTADFMRGYWDGNGSKDEASICTGSRMLAEQVVNFLKLNNIETKIRIRKAGTYKYRGEVRPTAENYQVVVVGKDGRTKFFNLIFYTDKLLCIKRKQMTFIYC
jgi:LAGLIDADG-like domain